MSTVTKPNRADGVLRRVLSRLRELVANPWGRPRTLVAVTWLYMIWSIVPVIIAIQFSFNDGRSISVWQGFNPTR